MIQFSVLLSRISISFHLSPLLRSVSITVRLWVAGSIRPTFPLISIFGQKLYTRCLFSWSSPGRRLLYYFPVFRTQFFISCRPNTSYIKENHAFLRGGRDPYSTFCMCFKNGKKNPLFIPSVFVFHIIFPLFFFERFNDAKN